MYHKVNRAKFYKNVMHHPMEDTFQGTKQPTKFSNQVFIGLLFSRIVLNGLKFVISAKEWEISAKGMKYPYMVSWWCNYLMYGE